MALNKVIVIASQKGGVGKTISTASLADIISHKQKRSVLVIERLSQILCKLLVAM